MTTFSPFVEIEVIGTIELIQTVEHIFAGMRVYNIQENSKTKTMSGVDKLLEVVWCSITRAGSKEVGYLISKC